jgi:hypothetical protein
VPGQYPEGGSAGKPGQAVDAGAQQVQVAAELVDHKSGHKGLVGGGQQRERAVERGEDTAAVDVGDDDRGQPEGTGQAHVGQVTAAQVDLRWAAGTVADNDVVLAAQPVRVSRITCRSCGRQPVKLPASVWPAAWPRTPSWLWCSASGLSSTGLNRTLGASPHAAACMAWARPISPARPSASTATAELLDMFWALNGATRTPRRYSHRQMPAVSTLLPASEGPGHQQPPTHRR